MRRWRGRKRGGQGDAVSEDEERGGEEGDGAGAAYMKAIVGRGPSPLECCRFARANATLFSTSTSEVLPAGVEPATADDNVELDITSPILITTLSLPDLARVSS